MSENMFNCIKFDDDNKQFTITIGDECLINYEDVEKVSVLNQQASFRGEYPPFKHQVLGGTSFLCAVMEPRLYVGLKIVLKNGQIKAAFISERATGLNTDIYREDTDEAKIIKMRIEERMNNY